MCDAGCYRRRCEAPAGSYVLKPAASQSSSCQYEIDIKYDKLLSHAPEGKFQTLGRLRILSFDIECAVPPPLRLRVWLRVYRWVSVGYRKSSLGGFRRWLR